MMIDKIKNVVSKSHPFKTFHDSVIKVVLHLGNDRTANKEKNGFQILQ